MVKFSVERTTGTFSFFDSPGNFGLLNAAIRLETDQGAADSRSSGTFEVQDTGKGTQALFAFYYPNLEINAFFTPHESLSAFTIDLEIRNTSPDVIRLGRCIAVSVQQPESLVLGTEPERSTFFNITERAQRKYVKRIGSDDGEHISQAICHIYNPGNQAAFLAGFITLDRIYTEHSLSFSSSEGVTRYEAYADFQDYKLDPGESISSERLLIAIANDPYLPLEVWADHVKDIYNPRLPEKSPVGVLSKTWVDAYSLERYHDVIERNSRLIRERLKGFDVDYYWIGGFTWVKDFNPGEWLGENREHFPNGLRATLDMLTERGYKPGLWIAPFWVSESAEEARKANQDNILRMKDGTPAPYPRKNPYTLKKKKWPYEFKEEKDYDGYLRLDGSHPGTLRFLEKVFQELRKKGVRYYMIDFLDAGWHRIPYEVHHDRNMVRGPEVYRNALKKVRETAGDDTFLLASTGPSFWNVGIVDSLRTSTDFGEGRPIMKHVWFYPASYVINTGDFWTSALPAVANTAALYFTHRKLYLNNYNCLTVGKPLSRSEAEINATVFGISGSPIMLTDEFSQLSDERLGILKKVLPQTQETAFPADLFTSIYPEDYPKVFRLPVESDWSDWDIVAVFNFRGESLVKKLDFKELRISGKDKVRVWDFWDERYLGTIEDEFKAVVPPRSCKVYRFDSFRDHPWVLSTDMHMQQGNVELSEVFWDEETWTLQGTAGRPVGESGNLFLISPPTYRVCDIRGVSVGKDAEDGSLVIRIPLQFNSPEVSWSVRFCEA